MTSTIVVLCIHDDQEVTADSHGPAEVTRGYEYLYGSRREQLLYHLPLNI